MSWSKTFLSESDRLLRGWVPVESDMAYHCIPWALALALLPTAVVYVVVYIYRLQRWWRRRWHEHGPEAPGRQGQGGGERAKGGCEETEHRWLVRSAQAAEGTMASLGLFAAGVAALQAERVRPLDANTHCLAYLACRALYAVWSLSHAFDWVSPVTAATPLRRRLAGPACRAALAALALAQVVVMFYEAAAARRSRFGAGARNIWFATF